MGKIVVLLPVNDAEKKKFEELAGTEELIFRGKTSITEREIQSAEVVIGNPPLEMLKGARALKWLQLNSAGANEFIQPGVLPEGTMLTNATGAYGLAISEHMLGMLLMLYKKLHLYRDQQKTGSWENLGEVRSVWGAKILVVGLGDIGGSFASLVKAMGAYTIGVRRTAHGKPDYLDEIHQLDALDTLLPKADVVAISLPGTAETAGLFSAQRIEKMKKGAVLLNVGRGNIVDTEALCDALEAGKLLGAGVDVTDPEPLPADHRLWKIPSAVVTPHISGGYQLPETLRRIVSISLENLAHYLNGEPLRNQVDFATGYRKL